MEEFVAGDEYWVNGQMDADGQPTIVGIGTYIRVSENGVQNLEIGSLRFRPSILSFGTPCAVTQKT